MSYVNKKIRIFRDRGDNKLEIRRSEARLKNYISATDARSWCDTVEDRRQHILELLNTEKNKCFGKLVPVESLLEILLSERNKDVQRMKCIIKQCFETLKTVQLDDDQKKKIEELKNCFEKPEEPSSKRYNSSKRNSQFARCLKTCPYEKKTGDKEEESVPIALLNDRGEENKLSKELIRETDEGLNKGISESLIENAHAVTFKSSSVEAPARVVTRIKTNCLPNCPRKIEIIEQSPVRTTTKVQMNYSPKQSKHPENSDLNRSTSAIIPETGDLNTDSLRTPKRFPADSSSRKRSESLDTKLHRCSSTCSTRTNSSKYQSPDESSMNTSPSRVRKIQISKPEAHVKSVSKSGQMEDVNDNVMDERNELRKKLDSCIKELENFKKSSALTFGTGIKKVLSNSKIPIFCKNELNQLEHEIEMMRSGNIGPDAVIQKEVELLQNYCLKLAKVEEENERLKKQIEKSSILRSNHSITSQLIGVQAKMENIEKLSHDRELLANKVKNLERELQECKRIPNQMNDYQKKCNVLEKVLNERDQLLQKLANLQEEQEEFKKLLKKSDRINDLENQLLEAKRNSRTTGSELSVVKSKCDDLVRELNSIKAEKEAMNNRFRTMEIEMENLRSKCKEGEMLRLEKDRLEIRIKELVHIQEEYNALLEKSKSFDAIKNEKDIYKCKYEELVQVECQCDMLRAQVEAAKSMGYERDALKKQVGDLQTCICDKEKELNRCICEIDRISKTKEEQQVRMKEAMANMRAEIEKKDYLIAASEEKISTIQDQLKYSIAGVSDETSMLKHHIEILEKELTQHKASLAEKLSQVKYLQQQLKEKDLCMCNDRNIYKSITKSDTDAVAIMKKELEAAKAENRKLQEIANKMVSITGDEHVQQMLKQSECAVKRVVEELGRQYQQWDSKSGYGLKSYHGRHEKSPKSKSVKKENGSTQCDELISHLAKFKERVCELEAENTKLKNNVDYTINTGYSNDNLKKELEEIQLQKEKLEKKLKKEMQMRQSLENKLKTAVNCIC